MWLDLEEALSETYYKGMWDIMADEWFERKLTKDAKNLIFHRDWYHTNKHRPEVKAKIKANNSLRHKSNILGRIPNQITCGHPERKHKGKGMCQNCYTASRKVLLKAV
jgi:hypothetical protein